MYVINVKTSPTTPQLQLRKFLTRRSDLVVNGQYKIGRKLAKGAFGQIRLGRHMVTKEGRFPVSGYVTVYCAQR